MNRWKAYDALRKGEPVYLRTNSGELQPWRLVRRVKTGKTPDLDKWELHREGSDGLDIVEAHRLVSKAEAAVELLVEPDAEPALQDLAPLIQTNTLSAVFNDALFPEIKYQGPK